MESQLVRAIELAKAGQESHARDLLIEVLREDACNVAAWKWLASVAQTQQEARKALSSILTLDPGDAWAQSVIDQLDTQRGSGSPMRAQIEKERSTMTTNTATPQDSRDASGIPQYRLPMILFMFAWPAAWFMFLIWVVRPLLFETPAPGEFISTWVFFGIATLGNAAELIVALIVLRREGYRLTIRDLRDRARFRWPKGWMKWGLVLVAVGVYALSIVLAPLDKALATAPGFVPPPYWPPMTNPTVEIAAPEDFFPDITLAGNYLFLAWFVVYGIVFNMIGEELYYRSMLLPKMRGVFGKWDWVANGLLFELKHVYQRWMWASGVFSSLAFALLGGPAGSVWLSMLFHWMGSFLLGLIAGIPLVFGGG